MRRFHFGRHAIVPKQWMLTSIDAVNHPDQYLDKLREIALRDQWTGDQLDWSPINFDGAEASLRQSVADMCGQLYYGEVVAFIGAARFSHISPVLSERLFSKTHMVDEARHVRWFAQLMSKLGCQTKTEHTVAHLMHEILDTDELITFVLGLHIFVEGMAHSFFMEGARAFSKHRWLHHSSRVYRTAKKVFGHWLPHYLGKDESRHIAFGVHYLKHQLATMPHARRHRLEETTERWIELFKLILTDPKINVVPGLNGQAIITRCVDELNRLLEKTGLENRIHMP